MECPNCHTEYDLHDERYDSVRDQVHDYYGCSQCGHSVHLTS